MWSGTIYSFPFFYYFSFSTMRKKSIFSSYSRRSTSWKGLAALLMTTGAMLFSSCEKEPMQELAQNPEAESVTLKQLLAMGFASQNIEDKGTYYLVEGDISFPKGKPVSAPSVKPGTIVQHQDQASTNALIAFAKQPNITVRIDGSIPSQWVADVQQAVSDWNSIPNCRVNLTLVANGTADITFSAASLYGAYGRGEFPSNGNPGAQVLLDVNATPSNFRRLVSVHELGHCLGFRHTDLYINGEGAGPMGGNIIPGTPNQDYYSIMNSGGAPNQQAGGWAGFSQYDVIGFQNLYPNIVPIGSYVWLRANTNNYVSSNVQNVYQQPNPGYLSCDRTEIGPWERFLVQDAGNGKVALFNENKYVSGEVSGAMVCNRDAVGDWEKFDWIFNEDGTVSLRANSNNNYVSSNNGQSLMTCDRQSIGPWEKFVWGQ